jgi:hypothetical protein
MTLESVTSVAEILASLGVIVSFFFVAYQIRQNTSQLQRNEPNSTMQQWSTIRMGIIDNRDVADIWKAGWKAFAIFFGKRTPPFEPAVHCIFAPDIDATYQGLKSSGANIVEPLEEKPWGRSIVLFRLEGYLAANGPARVIMNRLTRGRRRFVVPRPSDYAHTDKPPGLRVRRHAKGG